MKKMMSLVLALVMCLTLCVPAMAAERETVVIAVENAAAILEFFSSQEYDSSKLYVFTYDNPKTMRILCPHCGYNTYRGSVTEVENPDKNLQGFLFPCPDVTSDMLDDTVFAYIVTQRDYCITCGYDKTVKYDKYYIQCAESGEEYAATERQSGPNMHRWLDWWQGRIPH